MGLLSRFTETAVLEYPDSQTVEVPSVLCHQADVSDQSVMDVQTRFINQARYKGDSVTITVAWPKSAPHEVTGCHLWVRGERYRIYGTPFPVLNSPTDHDMRITCTRSMFLYDVSLRKATRTKDEWGGWATTWEEVPVKANLLRLSDDKVDAARARELSRLTLFELQPGAWDDSYTSFSYQGENYSIQSINRAEESVVISGVRSDA